MCYKALLLGIIKKQTFQGSFYSYLGVGLGFIISGILFPNLLSHDEIGLLRILVSYSTLFAQFALFGVNTVTVKLFPVYRDEDKKHHGFLGLALLISLAGFLLTSVIYLSLHDLVVDNAKEKSALFVEFYYYVIPMMFFTVLFGIFDTYYRVLYNAVKGIVYKEVIQRLLIILAVTLYFFRLIDFRALVILYTIAIVSPAVLLMFALIKDKIFFLKPDFSFISKNMARRMADVAFFGIITSYSGVVVMNVDLIMVDHYLGLGATGIYAITFFFGTLILVPLRTMGKISSVVISDAWENNDRETILDIYKKSSLTLSVIGFLIFLGIWGNIDNIFKIIGEDFEPGRYVILFVALANITDVLLGVSPHIIINSPNYRWFSFLLIFFAAMVVLFNFIFIPVFGIVGAAFASFVAKFLYNASKYAFLYRKYSFSPFSAKHIYLFVISGFTWFISSLIPDLSNFVFDIIIRSFVIVVIFLPLVYKFKISEDINLALSEIYAKYLKRG